MKAINIFIDRIEGKIETLNSVDSNEIEVVNFEFVEITEANFE